MNNHYHFIAEAPNDAATLQKLLRQLHSITAIDFNRRDFTPGRQVWCNFWDTCLTYEKSYLARLHYIHLNPVKHGLVGDASNYPFCSYKWFLECSDEALKQKVLKQPFDRLNMFDDY